MGMKCPCEYVSDQRQIRKRIRLEAFWDDIVKYHHGTNTEDKASYEAMKTISFNHTYKRDRNGTRKIDSTFRSPYKMVNVYWIFKDYFKDPSTPQITSEIDLETFVN